MWIIDLNKRKDKFKYCSNCEYRDEDYVLMYDDKFDDSWDEFKIWCSLNNYNEVNLGYVCENWKPSVWDGTKFEYDKLYRLTKETEYPQSTELKTCMIYTQEQIFKVFEERRKKHRGIRKA